jgi:thymidylate synthase
MHVFTGETFAECYKESLDNVMAYGRNAEARGTSSKELLDVALVVLDPRSCLYTNTYRSSQLKYIAAEFLWYYMGRNDVAFIAKWAKFWEVIQNEDGTANSAYGNLIFKTKNEHGFSQYQWAINSLMADKDTRQAVMHFNLPVHQFVGNKDFVCTMYVNTHIRDNKLYMKLNIRSNDAIWGTPTDAAFFCSLQMQMLAHLQTVYPDLQLGTYTHCADSYHVYDRHYVLTNNMLTEPFEPMQLDPIVSNLIDFEGQPTPELITLFKHINNSLMDYLVFQDGDDIYHWIYKNVTKTK